MANETSFQKGLNSFMERKGLSNRRLGELIGVSHMSISFWRNGTHEPKMRDVEALAREGMSIVELFGEDTASKLMTNGI